MYTSSKCTLTTWLMRSGVGMLENIHEKAQFLVYNNITVGKYPQARGLRQMCAIAIFVFICWKISSG